MGRVAGLVALSLGVASGGVALVARFWPHGQPASGALVGAGCLLIGASLAVSPGRSAGRPSQGASSAWPTHPAP